MSERHDEQELLALIEGDLAPEHEQRLRARLAGSDPKVLDLIDRMRADRRMLRSVPEPQLPEDFLAEIEPVLARPMLIPPPDDVRRRHRRRLAGRRLAAPILLAAAGVAVTAGAGIWAMVHLPRGTGSAGELLAAADPEAPPIGAGAPSTSPPAPPASEAPPPRPRDSGGPAPRASRHDDRPAPSAPLAATFALVIDAADSPDAERRLGEALARLDPAATALVRNLDQAEADAITEQWHQARARGGDRAGDAPVAGAGGPQQARRSPDAGSRPPAIDRSVLRSRQLAGPAELAPSYEQQLGFSARGATHTIALPADRLADLLAGLAGDGQVTTLRLLEGARGADGGWSTYGDVRRVAAQLLDQSRGGVILLPVEVRQVTRGTHGQDGHGARSDG